MIFRCELKYAWLNPETQQYEPAIEESWYEMRNTQDDAMARLEEIEAQIRHHLENKNRQYILLKKECQCLGDKQPRGEEAQA